MEKNWGSSFPSEWLWMEAAQNSTVQFAFAGGPLSFNGLEVTGHLLGYRSPRVGSWNFHPLGKLAGQGISLGVVISI